VSATERAWHPTFFLIKTSFVSQFKKNLPDLGMFFVHFAGGNHG